MKIIVKYMICAIVLLGFVSSCTSNFEEYNTNPNEPTSLESGALITQLINCLASPEENPCQRNNTFWAAFGGYVTATNTWNWGNYNYYTYNVGDKENRWSADWYFTEFYKNYFSILRMNQASCIPLAKLLRVDVMQRVACMQGPLPYSKVKEGTFTVPYDDEETAFKVMFDDLDASIRELSDIAATMTSDVNPLIGYDPIYNGDYKKWVKYANSLKLRMAIRIARIEGYDEYAHQKALEAVTHPIGVMESSSDTAWDHLNGRYKNGFETVQGWGEIRANACIVAFMNGYQDPRREVYFKKINDGQGDAYIGVRSGISGITTDMYKTASKFNVETTTPMLVFSAAEVAFLRAEANLIGWTDVCDNAETYYKQGISISFAERGISSTHPSAYYNNSTDRPAAFKDMNNSKYNYTPKNTVTIKWENSASDEEKLNRIITQKWIANFPLGHEAWNDYRRTGYPDIFPAGDNLSTRGITSERGQRRLRFSQTEYETNSSNVKAAAAAMGGDKETTDLWWAKKN